MIIDVTRIIKEGKLIALFWSEQDILFIKDDINKQATICIKSHEPAFKSLFIKNYCSENNSSLLTPILLEKEHIDDFYQSVNNKKQKVHIKIPR